MALSRCSLVRRIQAYCPYRLANDLPHRIPVWETNRTLQVFGEKHNQNPDSQKKNGSFPGPPAFSTNLRHDQTVERTPATPFDLAD